MRQYINAARLLTKIKMLRSGKISKGFILVEGITDYRLYSKFVDENMCELIIADSKSNVTQCIEICNREKAQGIIGIVDADFWRLEKEFPKYENLFLTDFHDLECMLINSPAYENILAEYANRNKYLRFEERKKKSLKHILLESGAKIGYLRWYSLQNNLGLKFSNLDFDKFVNAQELEIDMRKLIDSVLIHSKKQNGLNTQKILKDIENLITKQNSLWEVCCGHDLIELLTVGLVAVFGEYNAKNLFPGNLEGSFRLAYQYNYFMKTKLYQCITKWQEANPSYLIFDDKIIKSFV
ncbi:DUF4435 domain-containing protein [Cellulosilyticum sp. I15G10I2]|uniref:DUF4435 domain-containing protein n=1 Tax=Cellulosilyticum sp. I15G10I2 TaxID=1892843 RepID=UPI00085C2E27|nr:DUF4435 domain-containing protein [Cellulosilyticum sp. I15G10I2]